MKQTFDSSIDTVSDRNSQKKFCRTGVFACSRHLQEGQHPLTGQRAANFRLLANQ